MENKRKSVVIWLTIVTIVSFFLSSCHTKTNADLLVFNGTIYTVDSSFSIAEAIVVNNRKIIFVGKKEDAIKKFVCTDSLNLNGKYVYPAFIDAHGHFYGFGLELNKVNLINCKSWDEAIQITKNFVVHHPNINWIQGRGWDQNIWADKKFPDNKKLNELFPNTPVFLRRVDGHAGIANDKALALANITSLTKIAGGEIIIANGKPTGLLIDNAMNFVEKIIPTPNKKQIVTALLDAQEKCFEAGLTTVADAGLPLNIIQQMDTLQKNNLLKMRIYAMVADDSISKNYFFQHGKIKTDKLNVCSMKYYADGALGSRGACLKHEYADRKNHFGFLLNTKKYFEEQAKICYEKGFQMNVHCIGDSANAVILKIMANKLKSKNNLRWRIEHAQIIDTIDLHYFADFSILPSIQPTFATSDMDWAETRVGKKYFAGGYLLKSFLKYCSQLPFGSDFPIESYYPVEVMFAATERKNHLHLPENGFKPEEAIGIIDALKGYTIWAAYACKEENEKGSLEKNKNADFIIFDSDILKNKNSDLFLEKPEQTWLAGERVFKK